MFKKGLTQLKNTPYEQTFTVNNDGFSIHRPPPINATIFCPTLVHLFFVINATPLYFGP